MAQTRLLAVLFTDVVGSTSWRASVGDAAADRLRQPFDELLRSTIAASDGTVIKGLGDGVMAVFDSATSAIEGAVALQRAVDAERRALRSAGLHVRVGLSVGDVHVDGNDVHGLPVVEAARLCAAAQGDQILCRDSVRALAGSRSGARAVTVGDLALKGLPEPLAACEILWEAAGSPAPMPSPLLRDDQFAFVGRTEERARLLAAWEDAKSGTRRACFLSGEPGVGKTRLVAEIVKEIYDQAALVLFGRCDEGLGIPYQPFAEALRHYVDHVEPLALGRFGGDLHRLVPELPHRVSGLGDALESDADTERHRLYEAVALWLSDASAACPVVLVLDDLQWATRPTIELLRHVLGASHASRLLVIATYRDSDVGPSHPMTQVLGDLLRADGSSAIPVDGLAVHDVLNLLSMAAGHDLDERGSDLATVLHSTTGGNAFFVAETLRNLIETGAIVEEGGAWVSARPGENLPLPLGVREVVRRRLSRLDGLAHEALEVGATIGEQFEGRLLIAAGGFESSTLEPALRSANKARLIEEVQGPVIAFRFAHALVRTTLYEDLSAMRRAVLHRRVAEAIEKVTPPNALRPADLAFHYGAAATDGDATKAVEWSTIAGRDASERLGFSEAVAHLGSALALRRRAGFGSDAEECDLMIELGHAQWALGDPGGRTLLLDAAGLADKLGDVARAARALLADYRGMPATIGATDAERVRAIEVALEAMGDEPRVERALLTSELALALTYAAGSYERRRALVEDAVAMARTLSSPRTLATCLQNYWVSIWAPGTIGSRHRAYDELDELGELIDDPVWHALAQPHRIVQAVECCDIDRAWRLADAFEPMAEDLGLPLVKWMAAFHRAGLLEVGGDLEGARKVADEARAYGEAAGQPDAPLFHSVQIGMVQLWHDDFEVLVETLEGVHQVFPDVPGLPPFLALMLQRAGRTDDALAVASDMLRAPRDMAPDGSLLTGWTVLADLVNLTGAKDYAPALLDVLRPNSSTVVGNGVNWNASVALRVGQLETLLGEWARAAASFDLADDIALRMRAPLWQAVAATERAWMHARRGGPGDRDRALELIDISLELAEPRGAQLLQYRCSLVLADL
ncbi:MAG: hypothetical protein QOG65_3007 [Actinomycetota bacterium]|nr:hypothetical protein [Actinomycetota bacterium]